MSEWKLDTCKCQAKAKETHTCPYREDLFDDLEFKCNCCESCTQECSDQR